MTVKQLSKRGAKKAERILVEKVNRVVAPYGGTVVGLGPSAVGVQGDARTYGRAVIIGFPAESDPTLISEVSTQVTNKVSQITRVLMDVPVTHPPQPDTLRPIRR